MKKLSFLLITLLALVLASCSKGDENLLRAIPEDTELLARIDMKATAKSAGYSWTDMLKTFIGGEADKEVKGLDWTGTVYAFCTERSGMTGMVMPVSDAEALKDCLTANGMTVTETDGVYTVDNVAAFDSKRFVAATGAKATPLNLHSLLKQEKMDDDLEELNEQVESIEDPIAIAIDGDFIKKQSGKDITTSMALASLQIDLDNIFLLIGVDATPNSAVISTSVACDDSEAQNQLEEIKKKLTPIKDEKIPFVADEYLALAAFNLKGSDLKQYSAMLGFDVDALLNALNGLATLTLTGLDRKGVPAFTFTAQANDIACLDKLMDQLSGFGIKVKDEGHHNWTIDAGMNEKMLVGAQGGYVFANFGNNMQRPKGNNTINLEESTVAYINCYASRLPGMENAGIQEVEFYATDDLTTHTTVQLQKTWKELLEEGFTSRR